MKRLLIVLLTVISVIVGAKADEITVENVTIPQGGSTYVEIEFSRTDADYMGFELKLSLPDGIKATEGSARLGERFTGTDHSLGMSLLSSGENAGMYQFVCLSFSAKAIPENNGTLLSVQLTADPSLEIGKTLEATLVGIEFSTVASKKVVFSNQTFKITIGEPADTRVVIDELSTSVPSSANGVDVRVKRTIKANEWSTICLPFAMTEAQVKAAFGDDVQLGDFNDYEYVDATDAIRVNFRSATAIEANHPYIIKVSTAVSEFTADGVDIDPQEAIVDFDTSRRKNQPRQFVGTYVANTVLDWGTLFLSDNQFWYSTGNTKMKGFRAYFNLNDLIPDFEDNYESRVSMVFGDDITTGISSLSPCLSHGEGAVYDLQGRRVDEPKAKGIYIVNGKKIKK